jgi:hypothetical protein
MDYQVSTAHALKPTQTHQHTHVSRYENVYNSDTRVHIFLARLQQLLPSVFSRRTVTYSVPASSRGETVKFI